MPFVKGKFPLLSYYCWVKWWCKAITLCLSGLARGWSSTCCNCCLPSIGTCHVHECHCLTWFQMYLLLRIEKEMPTCRSLISLCVIVWGGCRVDELGLGSKLRHDVDSEGKWPKLSDLCNLKSIRSLRRTIPIKLARSLGHSPRCFINSRSSNSGVSCNSDPSSRFNKWGNTRFQCQRTKQ